MTDRLFGLPILKRRPAWWCRGCTREVFLIGRWAVKIPSLYGWKPFLHGLLANMQENLWWYETKWEELCPVVFRLPGGFLTIMRRATPLNLDDWIGFDHRDFCTRGDSYATSNYDQLGPDCRYAAGAEPESMVIPCEAKMESFGWLDDRIVVIDYGN